MNYIAKNHPEKVTGPYPMVEEKPWSAMTLKERVEDTEAKLQCNCDLDNWEPEKDTGHSWVCRIARKAKSQSEYPTPRLSPERQAYDDMVLSSSDRSGRDTDD